MKILIIGFITFSCWAALSTYIYVCRIKGLCDKPQTSISQDLTNTSTKNSPDSSIQAILPEGLVVYFDFDKSEFISNADAISFFDKSSAYLNQNSIASISIVGHTDAIGTDLYNQNLGQRRANSIRRYFESKGQQPSKLILLSKGEKEPADENKSPGGRAKNRRAVITIKK